METSAPKTNLVEILIIMSILIIADLLNWIPILNIILAILTLGITQLYFKKKGLKTNTNLILEIGEFVPIISVLPLASLGAAITFWIDHHPKSKIASAAKIANSPRK